MKTPLLYSLTLLALSACFVSCSDDDSDVPVLDNPAKHMELTGSEHDIMASNATFSFKLFKAANDNFRDNDQFVISPLSASQSLSMLLNGAAGETLSGSMNELGLQGHTLDELNSINSKLMDSLNTLDKKTTIEFANSMWLNQGLTALPSYTSAIQEYYMATLFNEDFSDNNTLDAINRWCSNASKGNISKLLESTPTSPMLLINALYFKSHWPKPFKNEKRAPFTTVTGEEQTVEYMSTTVGSGIFSNGKCKATRLPYGNGIFGFYILLPGEGISVDECINDLAENSWLDNIENFSQAEVTVKMPKFEITSRNDLVSSLKSAGLTACFSPEADYSNLFSSTGYTVTDVLQVTTINVDEEGTVATSSTVVGGATSPEPVPSVELNVNRPFLFIIKERSTDAILFMGKVGKI